ncbi:MAG: hypothetical protein ACK4TA_22245 [Saprospiraceae bacterium]
MKTRFFLLSALSLLLFFTSCENTDDEANVNDDIVGVWNLTRITGGFAGTGYQADFTEVEFKDNGTYRINNHDEAKGEGTYSFTNNDKLILKMVPSDSIKIGFEEYAKEVTFERDKLILSDPCCDLFQYEFGKAGN